MIDKNAQERLAAYLAGYAADVIEEWMRIVEIDEDTLQPGSGQFQARATWHGDRSMTLGTSQYADDLGTYRLVVRMEPVQVPPIGPEDDGALRDELAASSINWDPDNPGCAPEACGGSRLDPCKTVMQTQGFAHDGDNRCMTCGLYGGKHDEECSAVLETHHAPEWIETSWLFVRSGDHVRLNGQEADVTAHSHQEFFADNTDRYRPKAWKHTEVTVELKHLPGRKLPFPPGSPVEVLMDRERKAIHLLQTTFGATEVVQ